MHISVSSTAKGDEKATEAVRMAVESPLLDTTINGASHVIINISGDISLMDANAASTYVKDLAGDSVNIIFGAKYDESMPDEATITVIATGLERGCNCSSKAIHGKFYFEQYAVCRQCYNTKAISIRFWRRSTYTGKRNTNT